MSFTLLKTPRHIIFFWQIYLMNVKVLMSVWCGKGRGGDKKRHSSYCYHSEGVSEPHGRYSQTCGWQQTHVIAPYMIHGIRRWLMNGEALSDLCLILISNSSQFQHCRYCYYVCLYEKLLILQCTTIYYNILSILIEDPWEKTACTILCEIETLGPFVSYSELVR